jgi:CHASE2 domain-containing sensor protein
MAQKPTLRIFISSPSDVRPERVKARQVIDRLERQFEHYFHIEAILWEREPLVGLYHFQDERNLTPPRETDIAVVIVWKRLGVFLPEDKFAGAVSGRRPVTGTEWEFEDALAGARATGKPELLFYRKTAPLAVDLDDQQALRERGEQRDLADDFVNRWFRSADGKTFAAAHHSFATTAQFEEMLYEHLCALIAERAGSVGGSEEIRWHGEPFRGLQSFDYAQAPVFFGRTRARNEMREQLARQAARGCAFVLVIGASGSGKSSLVKAGLLPDLALPGMIGHVALTRWGLLRPSDAAGDLINSLAAAILQPTALPELSALHCDAQHLAALLRAAPAEAVVPIRQGLAAAGKAGGLTEIGEARLVLVIDQLEEIFTIEGLAAEASAAFVAALEALARSGLVFVIATMRSDFYDRLETVPRLAALANEEACYRLLPPDAAELGQIIRQPARESGLRFAYDGTEGKSLDEVIHQAACRDRGVLPMLSFLLDQLWKDRQQGELTFAAYHGLGGLEGALGRRADEIFAQQAAEVQAALPHLLRALVTVGQGIVASRPVALAAFPETSAERRLIAAFLAPQARLLIADDEGTVHGARVRVAHEALLTHWGRARDWIIARRADLELEERLEADAARWSAAMQAHAAPDDHLLTSPALLAAACELVERAGSDVAAPIRDYVAASLAADTRRRETEVRRRSAVISATGGMSMRSIPFYRPLVLVLLALALLLRYQDPQVLQRLRALAFDTYQRLSPAPYDPQLPVRVVNIDEQSLALYGQWPWPRTRMAELTQALAAKHAAAVAFDLQFSEPDRWSIEQYVKTLPPDEELALAGVLAPGISNDQAFASALKSSPSVVAVSLDNGEPNLSSGPVLASVATATAPVGDCPLSPFGKAGFSWAGNCPAPFIPSFANANVLSVLEQAAAGAGAVNYVPEADNIVRRVGLVYRQDERLVPSLAAETIRVAHGETGYVLISANASGENAFGAATGLSAVDIGDLSIPTDPAGAVMPRFRQSNPSAFIPAWRLLDGSADEKDIAGRIILVGTTAAGQVDFHPTPVDAAVPGVEIYAQLIENVLGHRQLSRPDYMLAVEELIILLVVLTLAVVMPRTAARSLALLIGVVGVALYAGGFTAYAYAGILVDPVYPILTLIAFATIVTLYIYRHSEAQRRKIRSAFDLTTE